MMDDSYPSHNPDGLDFPAPDSARIFDNAEVDDRLWTDFAHLASNNFRPERGLYFYSSFKHSRHGEYIGPWSAILTVISLSEMHMYHAEALAQTGNLAGAAAILNDPAGARKVRGGLPDVAADAAAIHAAIHHERMVEQHLDGEQLGAIRVSKNNYLMEKKYIEEMNFEPLKSLEHNKMTLIIADTTGFHKRGILEKNTIRNIMYNGNGYPKLH